MVRQVLLTRLDHGCGERWLRSLILRSLSVLLKASKHGMLQTSHVSHESHLVKTSVYRHGHLGELTWRPRYDQLLSTHAARAVEWPRGSRVASMEAEEERKIIVLRFVHEWLC